MQFRVIGDEAGLSIWMDTATFIGVPLENYAASLPTIGHTVVDILQQGKVISSSPDKAGKRWQLNRDDLFHTAHRFRSNEIQLINEGGPLTADISVHVPDEVEEYAINKQLPIGALAVAGSRLTEFSVLHARRTGSGELLLHEPDRRNMGRLLSTLNIDVTPVNTLALRIEKVSLTRRIKERAKLA